MGQADHRWRPLLLQAEQTCPKIGQLIRSGKPCNIPRFTDGLKVPAYPVARHKKGVWRSLTYGTANPPPEENSIRLTQKTFWSLEKGGKLEFESPHPHVCRSITFTHIIIETRSRTPSRLVDLTETFPATEREGVRLRQIYLKP